MWRVGQIMSSPYDASSFTLPLNPFYSQHHHQAKDNRRQRMHKHKHHHLIVVARRLSKSRFLFANGREVILGICPSQQRSSDP